MSNKAEKDKRQIVKDVSQASNPAKNVKAPKLPVKHEFTLDKDYSKKEGEKS